MTLRAHCHYYWQQINAVLASCLGELAFPNHPVCPNPSRIPLPKKPELKYSSLQANHFSRPLEAVKMMPVNKGGQLGKGKKLGPYKKWLTESEHFIEEGDGNIIQYTVPKRVKEGSLQTSSRAYDILLKVLHTSPSAEQCTLHSDNTTVLPDYTPPVEDTDEDPIDSVWDKLCTSLKGRKLGPRMASQAADVHIRIRWQNERTDKNSLYARVNRAYDLSHSGTRTAQLPCREVVFHHVTMQQ
ncbi:hypothetical protein NDU88_002422 [Pleurodeles waltl]|uniref:Uncharacterized protein n=1 Tax=Pleurodeles waltl TaxID=8319 RepID=A0AAV7NIK4_PLEWA|nr:hypothetical protein NDU88_002422 [Pleurodeles waltl]